MFLQRELNELSQMITHSERINGKISKQTVNWHIDHTLKVIIVISDSIINSKEKIYKRDFNFLRTVIFSVGIFPRGKGKAPKAVIPQEIKTQKELEEQIILSKKSIEKLLQLSPNSCFKHPYFGMLNLKQTKKSILIHTKHHLKIIRDIVK